MWEGLLCIAILAYASFGVRAASATAESYPSKPIRFIGGFSAGGSSDYLARLLGPKIAERLGQPVIVEDRPGANGNVGAEIVARSNPDGYTLFMAITTSLTSSRSLYTNLRYDLLKDFSYVSLVATGTHVLLAHPSLPVKSLAEFVDLARSKPKSIRYGSAGAGSSQHLVMELMQSRAGIELLHIPYKGGAPAAVALTGGEVQIVFSNLVVAMPMIQAKRLNALAVSSAKRLTMLPNVPTVAESGYPGFNMTTTWGVLARAGTPAAVVKLLNTEIRNIMQTDDVRAKLATQGLEAAASTPDEFKAFMEADVLQWARVIKDRNITVN